jgi:AcrR family transcriptional regulator
MKNKEINPIAIAKKLQAAESAPAEKIESRKTRYTKMVLRAALIELLKEQPIGKITVTEICARADVSRGTFYLHYQDPYDLLDKTEDELLETLESSLLSKAETEGAMDIWKAILDDLLVHRELSEIFFSDPGSSFVNKCLMQIRPYTKTLCSMIFPEKTDRELDLIHTFYECGSANLIGEWVRGGFAEPTEQIAALLSDLNGSRGKSAA